MAYLVECDQPFTVDGSGVIACSGVAYTTEKPPSLVDLTQQDISDLSTAVLLLFVTAFVFRSIRKFITSNSAGRT